MLKRERERERNVFQKIEMKFLENINDQVSAKKFINFKTQTSQDEKLIQLNQMNKKNQYINEYNSPYNRQKEKSIMEMIIANSDTEISMCQALL